MGRMGTVQSVMRRWHAGSHQGVHSTPFWWTFVPAGSRDAGLQRARLRFGLQHRRMELMGQMFGLLWGRVADPHPLTRCPCARRASMPTVERIAGVQRAVLSSELCRHAFPAMD